MVGRDFLLITNQFKGSQVERNAEAALGEPTMPCSNCAVFRLKDPAASQQVPFTAGHDNLGI